MELHFSYYHWNMKCIALKSNYEYYLNDNNNKRKVKKDYYLLIYENCHIEIITKEELTLNYQMITYPYPNYRIYTKINQVIGCQINHSFIALQGKYQTISQPNNYFVSETTANSHQYILTPGEASRYLIPLPNNNNDNNNNDNNNNDNTNNTNQQQQENEIEIEDEEVNFLDVLKIEKISKENPLDSLFSQVKKAFTKINRAFSLSDDNLDDNKLSEKSQLDSLQELEQQKEEQKQQLIDNETRNLYLQRLNEITNSNIPIDIDSVDDITSIEHNIYNWDLENFSYFGVEITTDYLTIEFYDLPILCSNKRYRGKKGDIIVYNTKGYFLGIFSPDEFNAFCEHQPFNFNDAQDIDNIVYNNTNTSSILSTTLNHNNDSKIRFITKIKCQVVYAHKLKRLFKTSWNGTAEYGGDGDIIVQFYLTNSDNNNYSETSIISFINHDETKSENDNNNTNTTNTTTTTNNNNNNNNNIYELQHHRFSNQIYQFITSSKNFRTFFLPTNTFNKDIIQLDQNNVENNDNNDNTNNFDSPKNSYVSVYIDPIPNYLQTISCWKGYLYRYVRQRWKRIYCIICPDYLIFNRNKGSIFFINLQSVSMKYDKFLEVVYNRDPTSPPPKRKGSLIKAATQKIKSIITNKSDNKTDTYYFSIEKLDISPYNEKLKENSVDVIEIDSLKGDLISLEDLLTLFERCRLASKRKKLCSKSFENNSYLDNGVSINEDELNSLLFGLMDEELRTSINGSGSFETFVHLIIQSNDKVIINYLFKQEKILSIEYNFILSNDSYITRAVDIESFKLLSEKNGQNDNLLKIQDSDGNTLPMLLLSRESYSLLLDLLNNETTKIKFPNNSEYWNIQNWKNDNLLQLTLQLFQDYSKLLDKNERDIIFELFKKLLILNCKPSIKDQTGGNCLHQVLNLLISVLNGDQELVKFYKNIISLISPEIDVTELNNQGETPFLIFSKSPNTLIDDKTFSTIANTLIQNYNTNDVRTKSKILNHSYVLNPCDPPLFNFAINGNVKGIQYLIYNNADIYIKNKDGQSVIEVIMQRRQQLQILQNSFESDLDSRLFRCSSLLLESQKTQIPRNIQRKKSDRQIEVINSDPNLKRHLSHTGKNEVEYGTISSIIDLLAIEECFQEIDAKAVILGYHHICNHEELLTILTEKIIKQPEVKGILSFVSLWFQLRKHELELLLNLSHEEKFILLLQKFSENIQPHCSNYINPTNLELLKSSDIFKVYQGFINIGKELMNKLSFKLAPQMEELVRVNSTFFENLFSTEPISTTKRHSFINIKVKDIVKQTSLILQYLFQKIPLKEFLSPNYDDSNNCPNIKNWRNFKQRFISYLTYEILSYKAVQERASVIIHLLRCITDSYEVYSNYELIEIISTVLRKPQIFRLIKTFEYVKLSHSKELETFYNLTESECSYLQEKMFRFTPPALPLINVYLKELTISNETPKIIENSLIDSNFNLNSTPIDTKKLNVKNLRIQSILISEIEKFQSIPYLFKYNEKIQTETIYCTMYDMDEFRLKQLSFALE